MSEADALDQCVDEFETALRALAHALAQRVLAAEYGRRVEAAARGPRASGASGPATARGASRRSAATAGRPGRAGAIGGARNAAGANGAGTTDATAKSTSTAGTGANGTGANGTGARGTSGGVRSGGAASPSRASGAAATGSSDDDQDLEVDDASDTAVAIAAPEPGGRRRWTRETVIAELCEWLISGIVEPSFLRRHGKPGLVPAATRIFGRFDSALNVANLYLAKQYPDGPPARRTPSGVASPRGATRATPAPTLATPATSTTSAPPTSGPAPTQATPANANATTPALAASRGSRRSRSAGRAGLERPAAAELDDAGDAGAHLDEDAPRGRALTEAPVAPPASLSATDSARSAPP